MINRIDELSIRSPLLISLRDKINFSPTVAEKELIIRTWKNDLIKQDIHSVLHVIQEIEINKENPYIKNTLLPLIEESLQQKTVTAFLDIIQSEYASQLGEDSFSLKKQAIKNKLKEMHKNGLIDNKLIFGLGIFLMQKNIPAQYSAGTFASDIRKWLYTGESIYSSFWDIVLDNNSHITEKKQETAEAIGKTLGS